MRNCCKKEIKHICIKIDKQRIQQIDDGGDIFWGSDGIIFRDTKYILIELKELESILPEYKKILSAKNLAKNNLLHNKQSIEALNILSNRE